MALYKDFKISKPSETLATEQDNLSQREREKVIDELHVVEESKGKRSKYRVWTPAWRAEIGKHAADHGNASTVRILGLRYPELKRQTVSDFKLAYLKLKKINEAANSDIKKIVKKKVGPPTLLSKSLMKKVQLTLSNSSPRNSNISII